MNTAIQTIRLSFKDVLNNKHQLILFAVVVFALGSFLAMFPKSAYASIFGDVLGLNDFIKGLFCDWANGLMSLVFGFIQGISTNELLVGSWQDLFGAGSTAFFRFATDICNGIVKPIGGTILAFVMLVQLVKISQRIDSSATMPALREMVVLFVMFAIFSFLISNADKLCAAIYEVVNMISVYINNYNPSWTTDLGSIVFLTPTDVDRVELTDVLGILVIAFLTFLCAIVAFGVAFVMALARNLQLYMYMTFAPVPIALLGTDETRQMGVGFLKNFASVCLAGTLMVFILMAFPFVVTSVLDFNSGAMGSIASLMNIVKVAGVCLLLVFALIKSGSTARDIFGG